MSEKKDLLPSKRYFNAKNIETFVNYELTRETSILRNQKADNVFSFSDKFNRERNSSFKFCLYGLVQSKWYDCNDLKIDISISDSSTNQNAQLNIKNPFWIYDKQSGISATTWSINSRRLDFVDGSLSRNIYFKKKASYFFPFEIDLESLTKQNGLNTNKSLYVQVNDIVKCASLNLEIPFLFFDDEGVVFEFGEETAEILDNGEILEINNNFPFLYDRHWIRTELRPLGPSMVGFSQESMNVEEGGLNSDLLENKIIPIEVILSEPSRLGIERVKIEVVYGKNSSGDEYTTINFPEDALFNTNYISWNFLGESPKKYFYLRIQDDFFVEPVEKLTLRLVPVLGLIPNPNLSQTMTLYFKDNDIPSKVSFGQTNIPFTEPRSFNWTDIPVTLELDRRLLVDNQTCVVYIDRNESDSKSFFQFYDNGGNPQDYVTFMFNKTDLSYTKNLSFSTNAINDIQRKIVLKVSGFTQNVVPLSTTQGSSELRCQIDVFKNLDDNYIKLLIPYDKANGYGVIRNVYNEPNANYDTKGQGPTGVLTSGLFFPNYAIDGNYEPYIEVSGVTKSLPNSDVVVKSANMVIYENNFSIIVKNDSMPTVFDGKFIAAEEEFSIDVSSGFTTNVSSNEVTYDGKNLIVKLRANDSFSRFIGFGYRKCKYKISIKNLTYNKKNKNQNVDDAFEKTNLLTNSVFARYKNPNLAQAAITGKYFLFTDSILLDAGNSKGEKNFSLYTKIENVFSQIQYDNKDGNVISLSGQTPTFIPSDIYYKGVGIFPNPYVIPKDFQTRSTIFISPDVLNEVNQFLSPPLQQTNNFGYMLPVATGVISEPVSAKTISTKLYFGSLYYQNGYGQISPTGVLEIPNQVDSFILSSNVQGTSTNNVVKKWSTANLGMKNNAMIEILNEGTIPAVIEGVVVGVGQKLYISETPIQTGQDNASILNIVKPLDQLSLNITTNYRFVEEVKTSTNRFFLLEKFISLRYRISFLNFNLYNNDGTPSNKTFSHTINLNKSILRANTNAIQGLFLRTQYNQNVLVFRNASFLYCGPNKLKNLAILDLFYSRIKGAEIRGMIASASVSCPIYKSEFVEANELNSQDFCNVHGVPWYGLEKKDL